MKFFAFAHISGPVNYFDATSKFTDTSMVSVNDATYIAGYYTGSKTNIPTEITEAQFLETKAVTIRASIIASIGDMQRDAIATLEGIDGWKMTRANEEAVLGDPTKYDKLLSDRAAVRAMGDTLEATINALSFEDLQTYTPAIDVTTLPEPTFPRMTVGAYIARFTDDEWSNFEQAATASPTVSKAILELQNRNSVGVGHAETITSLNNFEAAGLLGPVIDADAFATRVDELLRPVTADEAYRAI